jgi:hypothetical protein
LYVSSEEKSVEIERRDGEGTLTLVRGTPVETRVVPLIVKENEDDPDEEGKEYRLVFIDEEEYLMTDEQLCANVEDSVKEKSGYTVLPAVLYRDPGGPAIAQTVNKNTPVEITGYANLLSDGGVDRYHVSANGAEGYIRSEYIVRTPEEVVDTFRRSTATGRISTAAATPTHWNIPFLKNRISPATRCPGNAAHSI